MRSPGRSTAPSGSHPSCRATRRIAGRIDTVNAYYRTLDTLTPADVQAAARKYFTDAGLIVTTLVEGRRCRRRSSSAAVAAERDAGAGSPRARLRRRAAPARCLPRPAEARFRLVLQKSVLPQLDVKLLFTVGSAHDPAGKEGLAALTAAMITEGGSKAMTIEQIEAALYPIAGSFSQHVDKEMTTFTGAHPPRRVAAVLRDRAAAASGARLPRRRTSSG